MTLIFLTACVLAALIAWVDANADAQHILAGHAINHADGLTERSVLGAVIVLSLWAVAKHYGATWWHLLGLALAFAAAFSIVFRARLNKRRGLPLTYVSLSNVYDSVFIRIFGVQAGTAAYTSEVLVLACGTIIYYLKP